MSICWLGEYRENSLHVELLNLLGLQRNSTSDALRVKEFAQVAKELGFNPKSIYFEAGWSKRLQYEDAFNHLASSLEKDGYKVDEIAIKQLLEENKTDNNLILSTTKAQKGACYFSVIKS